MSTNLYQFDKPQLNAIPTVINDISDDLQLSNTTFDDLFSDYDVNTNDFHYFDPSTYDRNYSQSMTDLSSSNKTMVHSMTTNSDLTTYIPLREQPQTPQLPSTDAISYQSDQINIMRKSTIDDSSLPSSTLSRLTKQPESISLTFDQFKALLSATSDRSKTNTNIISTLLEHSTIIGHNIPLKITSQTSQNLHSTSLHTFNHQDSQRNVYENVGRSRRKPSYTVIEKRYRSSINEKIDELKEIVAINDGKIQKSGVLRRTVEYIRQLQSTNQRLEEENTTLKTVLKRFNLTNANFANNNDVQASKRNSLVKNSTPPSFTVSEDSNHGTYTPVAKRQKRTNSKRGMVNGSRLALCCFMVCVLIINPWDYLLDRIHSSNNSYRSEMQLVVRSRTLQAEMENGNSNSSVFFNISWKQLITWLLNISIWLACLVKLFVHGESIVDESEMDEYYVDKKKADQLINENQLNEARIYYEKCCEHLYIPIGHTYLYYMSSITWQFIRLYFNCIYIGRWLIYWSGWTKSIDTRHYNLELNDCLLQLWKIEYHSSTSSLLALCNFFLFTMNTSINCGRKLQQNKRNEIYLLSAFTLKRFSGIFPVFIRYLLKSLRSPDINDIWLLDIDRLNQFIRKKNIDVFKHKIFIESIRLQYYEYVLYENIVNQLLCQDQQQIICCNELDRFSWWQHCLQVLRCISSDKQNIKNIPMTNSFRQMKASHRIIYHTARVKQLVDHRYIILMETIHTILIVLTDDKDQTNSTRTVLLEQLGQSSRLFTTMIDRDDRNEDNLDMPLVHCCCIAFMNFNICNGKDSATRRWRAIKTLLLDSILSLRLRLLTSSMTHNNEKIPYLDDFQRELDHYKQVNQSIKLRKQRLYLFEAIFRISSGLNPLTTQTLFERAIKQTNEESSPDLDIIAALLLFCHFLPSTVYRYRNILQQVVTSSSKTTKNNNLHHLQRQCLMLIRQPCLTL